MLLALELKVLLVVVVDVQTKSRRVDVPVAPNKQGTKDGLSKNVEDSVRDDLLIDVQVAAAVSNTPDAREELAEPLPDLGAQGILTLGRRSK